MITKGSTIKMCLKNIKGKNKTKLIFDNFKIILPKDVPFNIGDELEITYIDSYISEGNVIDMFQIEDMPFTSRAVKGEPIPVTRDAWSVIENSIVEDGDYAICYNKKTNTLYAYNIYDQEFIYTSLTMSKEKAEEIISCIQNTY